MADHLFGGEGIDQIDGRAGEDVLYGDGERLFIASGEAKEGLDSGRVNDSLRTSFEEHHYHLPNQLVVTVVELDREWSISSDARQYRIKNEKGTLTVFAEGEEDQLIGGDGNDHVSISARTRFPSSSGDDHDIEGLSDDQNEYFDLMHRHRDAWGFIVTHNEDGEPDEINDAGIFTGIALATAALRGDHDAVKQLLETLRDELWVDEGGHLILARHPNSFNYSKNGDQFICGGNQPITKDGIVGITTGLYYAYSESSPNKQLAKEVMGKYITYLQDNQWKTIAHYPDDWWEKDGKYFATVFSGDAFGLNGEGRTKWKGPEGYMLSPSDMYAIQNVASKMGFATEHWQPWLNYGETILQVLGDGAEQVVELVKNAVTDTITRALDSVLKEIKLHSKFSFHVIPGVDWTLVEGADIEISQSDRENIIAYAEDAFCKVFDFLGTLLRTFDPAIDYGTDIPAFLSYYSNLAGRIADQIVRALPDWAQGDIWRSLVDEALQQTMPWLTGNAFGELIAFELASETAKEKETAAHLAFWPTLLMYETRADMADLLRPMVADVHGALNSKMDMLLYAWLDNDTGKVDEWIQGFESNRSYGNLAYAWVKPKKENSADIAADPAMNPGHHRLDYLILKALKAHGVPEGTVAGNWIDHWSSQAKELWKQVEQFWDNLRGDIIEFTETLCRKFRPSLPQLATALWGNVTNEPSRLFWALAKGADAGYVEALKTMVRVGSLQPDVGQIARFLLNDVQLGLVSTARTIFDWLDGDRLVGTFLAIAHGANRGPVEAIRALISADLLSPNSFEIASFLIYGVKAGLGTTARTVSDLFDGDLVTAFWSIAKGAGLGVGQAVVGVVSAGLVKNDVFEVAHFLIHAAKVDVGTAARGVSDWLGGNSVAAFWGIANGARLGIVQGVHGVVAGGLVENSAYDVAAFLIHAAKVNLGTAARTVSDWLGGNPVAAFWSIANGAGLGLGRAVQGVVEAGLVRNGSYDVAAFLIHAAKVNLGTAARAVSDWLGGDPVAAFWSIANGAGLGLGRAVQGVVEAGLVKNDSYEVAKFLIFWAKTGLGDTAKGISDWLGGDRIAAFWAIADGAGQSYVKATKGLIWAGLLSNSYKDVLDFLTHRIGWKAALGVVDDIF